MRAFFKPAWPLVAVFVVVLAAQWWLVAAAGTDIPFHDQWILEGTWLYPRWLGGEFRAADWFHAGNENRIFWTYALDVALLALNGQWDPLLQLTVNAVLRAGCATLLAALLGRAWPAGGRAGAAGVVILAFLPVLAWHNALWAVESHAYFVLGFVVATLALLEPAERPPGRTCAGILAGLAALVSMSPAALAFPALMALAVLRAVESRRWAPGRLARELAPSVLLLAVAWLLRVHVAGHDALGAQSVGGLLAAGGRLLAWPHSGAPVAALAMNAPLALAIGGRLAGRRRAAANEDFVLLLGLWAAGVAAAGGWLRGGSAELAAGVPSRYVDFLVLLPLANLWCALTLAREAAAAGRPAARPIAVAWVLFLALGWIGLSAETLRGVILPRARDPLAPVRLARAFQLSGDPAVFANQPRLLVPHPDPRVVQAVLRDPRLAGRLPPSLQPERPLGPGSRFVRWLLRR